jgi:hypothetical protein
MEDELREKNKLIDSLAKEVNDLNEIVADCKQKEGNSNQIVLDY